MPAMLALPVLLVTGLWAGWPAQAADDPLADVKTWIRLQR